MERGKTCDRILEIVEEDRQELVDLCLNVGNILSPHGKERRVGEAVLDWLKKNRIDGFLQFITEESVNTIGLIPGSGDGESLIFNAHMDTGPELRDDAPEAAKKIEGAWVDGELI